MNREITGILRDRLVYPEPLPYIDKYFSMVEVIKEVSENGDNRTITKRLPIGHDFVFIDDENNPCCIRKEQLAIPSSKLNGLIYFEENGARVYDRNRRGLLFRSKINLICWLNVGKIRANSYENVETAIISEIINRLEIKNKNIGSFNSLNVNFTEVSGKSNAIFSKYTYDEEHTQYLRPPFEYFKMVLDVEYMVNSNCINKLEINKKDEKCCD